MKHLVNCLQTDLHAPYLYDAVYLYALVAKATLQDGGDIRNGSLLADKTKLMTFNGKMTRP